MKKQIYYLVYYSFVYNTDVELSEYINIFDRINKDEYQELINKFEFIETDDELDEAAKTKEDKYRAILSPEELRDFITECGFDNTCETKGLLDKKGYIPAICFENDFNESAYVGPIFSDEDEKEVVEEIGKYNFEHTKVILHRIQSKFDEILNFLSDNILNYEMPDFMKKMEIDVQQREINFPGEINFPENMNFPE